MPADLRERLVAAADEPVARPDTNAILRRASARRVRTRAAISAAAVLIVVGGLLGIRAARPSGSSDVVTEPVREPAPRHVVEIDQQPGEITVRLLDAGADPADVERELRAVGIDATVEVHPVVPSFVGEWIFTGSSEGPSEGFAVMPDDQDRRVLHFRLPLSGPYQLAYGRPARPNENYASSTIAFLPGEVLHCTGIEDLAPVDAEAAINALGYEVSWRYQTTSQVVPGGVAMGYSEIVTEPPDGLVTSATLQSPTVMVVFVSPFGDFAANHQGVDAAQGEC